MNDAKSRPLPAMPFLEIDDDGRASLIGSRCQACGAIVLGKKDVCPCCTMRGQMAPMKLGEHGKVYTYTIVSRSFPGVKTPFVPVVVDLDGGGSLAGVLLDVAPDPSAIAYDMPVDVVFRDTGQRAADGRPFVSHYFVSAAGDGK
jgi:uncharacterized OB-fold protein